MIGTFESKDPAVGIHQSRVSSNWPPQWLHRHAHIDYNNTVLRRCLSHTNILIRFHRHMSKSYKLLVDPNTRKLNQFNEAF